MTQIKAFVSAAVYRPEEEEEEETGGRGASSRGGRGAAETKGNKAVLQTSGSDGQRLIQVPVMR